MIRAVIFDMDGTILNTLEDLTDSINAALNKFGMPLRGIDEVRSFVGNGIHKTIERAVPEGTEEKVGQIRAVVCYKHCLDRADR